MKVLMLLILMTSPVLADCKVDYSCSRTCINSGEYYPGKIMQCRQMCMVCNQGG